MRILIVDTYGDGVLDWALRCQQDGHQVKLSMIRETKTEKIGRGLIDVIPDWREWIRWADLVFVTDNTRYLRELDAWRKQGVAIVGPSQDAAQWELDRTGGMKVFQKHGIAVPEYREFSDYDKAISYVKREGRPFVSKPCGVEGDKALSYVAKSAADLVYMLERWKKAHKHKGSFILQEIVKGCEMAVGGWFGPGGFNEGWHENWEFKKLFPGDMGPNTGEQGTVLRVVRQSKLARKVLAPLADALERLGYVGYVDVNTIIDEKGNPWPLEFTMRPGWPTFNIQQALVQGDHAEWLAALAQGRDTSPFAMNEVAVGVVMAIPDYPYSHATRKEVVGVPIYGLKPSIMDNIHPCQIMLGEAPQESAGKVVVQPCWVTAGDYLLVATGTGKTVREAKDKANRVLANLKATPASPFWRTDIGTRLKRQLPEVQKSGYAAGLEY